jgi:hypothetical protein
MRIVQALHWLKPKISAPEDRQRIRQRIASMLSDHKRGAALRKDLKNGLASLRSWMQDFLRDMVSGDRAPSAKSSGRKPGGKRRKAPVA